MCQMRLWTGVHKAQKKHSNGPQYLVALWVLHKHKITLETISKPHQRNNINVEQLAQNFNWEKLNKEFGDSLGHILRLTFLFAENE